MNSGFEMSFDTKSDAGPDGVAGSDKASFLRFTGGGLISPRAMSFDDGGNGSLDVGKLSLG
jgi:hypothetical protein